MKRVLFFVLAVCFCLAVPAQDAALKAKFEASIDKLVRSVNEHDFKLLEPLLAEGFILGGIRCPSTCGAPMQAMRQITGPDFRLKIQQAVVKGIKPEGTDYVVSVDFRVKDKDSTLDLILNAQGQFLDIYLPGLQFRTPGQDAEGGSLPQAGQGAGCGSSAKGCGND